MNRCEIVALLGLCLALLGGTSAAEPASSTPLYDPGRDPLLETRAASQRARDSERRVLLIVGNERCLWCYWLQRHLEQAPVARQALERSFETVHVYYGEDNPNDELLGGLPPFERFPHLFVLDGEGRVLASRDAAVLIDAGRFDSAKIIAFAEHWRVPAGQRQQREEHDVAG